MSDINAQVIHTFNQNIDYFKLYQPSLFHKLSSIENAIENNLYKERYELIYENESFDVLEKSTDNSLYDKQTNKYTELAVDSVNQKADNNVFQAFHKRDFTQNDLNSLASEEPFTNHLSGFAPLLHYMQTTSTDSGKIMADMHKFVFFGTGLGLHIIPIDKKISAKIYLIIEDDLELFRLSLFTTNYKELANNSKLFFSVFDDDDAFTDVLHQFLELDYHFNHYIKYFHMLNHSQEKQTKMHQLLTSQPHLTFYYNTMLTQYTRPIRYILGNYSYLTNKLSFNDKHLREKPFLFLAAGPSLEKNKDWLKKNHMFYVIVAVAATLPLLEQLEISPDLLIQLDGHLASIEHFNRLESLKFLQNTTCIFSDKTPLSVIDKLQPQHLFLFENTTNYKTNSLKPIAHCVGSVGFEILLRLHVKNIYLLGLDLAVDSETGLTHSPSHINPRHITIQEETNEEMESTLDYKSTLVKIEGNLEATVSTTQHFLTSVEIINHLLKTIKESKQIIFNLSSGAKFQNTNPLELTDAIQNKEIDKSKVSKHIQKICKQNASNKPNPSELKILNSKIENAKEVKMEILNYANRSFNNTEEYLETLIVFSKQLSDKKKIQTYELHKIFEAYLKYIMPFLVHFLGKVTSKDVEVTDINKLFVKHLIEIVNFYKESLARE
jgi:hypothetical protein